ncbi:MAG: hypothetical protein M4D80_24810 [Myxococcota bacterium]|nr:hypothetical protein [Myxococcota bacterium]
MYRLALIVVVAAGCTGDKGPRASGALVFTERSAADVFLATEAEVMRSEPILRRIREDAREELSAKAISVKRRSGTMILDVTVRDKSPQRAAMLCNRLMETYFEFRMSLAIMEINVQMQALAEQLERAPQNAELERQLAVLETKRMTRVNDVRVLAPCTPASSR